MMVQSVSTSRILPTPRRPTTPPRDSGAESKPPDIFSRILTRAVSSQADITPASSSETPSQLEQSKKKVAFDESNDNSGLEASAQPVSGERKPLKSILKPYNGNQIHIGPQSKLSPPHTYANLAAMLESVAQQLAGTDRNSKMDAYTTLSGVLKASENVPDVRALKEKMVLLLAFVQRDLTAKSSTGALDTTLVVNALMLLSIFLHKPAIADSFTANFSTYLVDHAIKTFQDVSMSKDVAKHLMLVLAEQKFPPKIMTGDRVFRLIASLHDIENYVKGKSIVMGRINIYRTLLRQSKPHMLLNTDWMQDLFGDMFSTVKETRASAITFGLEAGFMLGTESKLTRAFTDLFSADLGDNRQFGEYYIGRLKAMIEGKHDVSSVPQIWSVPILFLRSKPRQLEQWAFLKPWLGIIQECFNCSDQQAKFEANLAWNRMVFAVQPNEKTSPHTIALLYKPLREQLKRKSKGRRVAIGSLCSLLYYSLKPTSTYAQLDLYWDRYIVEAVGNALSPQNAPASNLELVRQDLMDACHILAGLFDSVTPRTWSETRAVDACGKEIVMETTELPALDSKWLRKSASRVFRIIGPLLEKLYWDLGEDTETVTILWKAYITSIASPAIKEVKVANETMSCVACIFGLLYKIWQIGPKSLQTVPPSESALSADFLSSFETIISTTITGLGLLPFTEKLLSIGNQHEFVVIATPSHQPKMARGDPKCPLHHLLVLLTIVSPELEYDRNFSQMVHRLLNSFLDARPSKQAKMDLILDLSNLLPAENTEPCRMIWSVLADIATSVTDTRDNTSNGISGMSDQPLGADYRKALRILELGMNLSPTDPLPGWKTLFEALVASATLDGGDSGRAIAVIEPLGRFLQSKFSNTGDESNSRSHIYFRIVLSKATYPKDRQAFDAARRKLWGTTGIKTSSFDPYNLLYDYMRESLEKAYASFTNALSLEYSDMITATTSLLSHCPISLLTNTFVKLQSGIASWIKDERSHIGGGTPLSQSITSMWSKLCQLIPTLTRSSNHSKLLADLEILLCSGLGSRHRSIVNSTIRLWNSTFGAAKLPLTYPANVKDVLLSLHRVTELQLPFFPESLESDGVVDQRQLPHFADTQGESHNLFGSMANSSLRVEPTAHFGKISPTSSTRLLKSYTPQVLIEVAQSVPLKRSRESTPDSSNRKSRQRNVTPRLRHDDSQIQFEAVDSSPINGGLPDLQLLTDRQKEVKERQQAEAAMFPDLRSSPRKREKSVLGDNSELPLHRSSSKSRAEAPPSFERETTPTIAPQVEYDDYVNSSPTPTRLRDPPSSPPEVLKEQSTVHDEDEMYIPSSPPEMPEDIDMETTLSVDPSAQVEAVTNEIVQNSSSFENTSRQQIGSSILETPTQPEGFKALVVDEKSIADAAIAQPSLVSERNEIQGTVVAAPDTPQRPRESSPGTFQTPRSEVFHDAQTSPSSSDKHTANEDVFEDAVSSPRLVLNKLNKEQASSPISYLDESSMLRMMAGYDQGSGLPRRSPRNVTFATNKENQNEPSLPTSSTDLHQHTASKEPASPGVSGAHEQSLPLERDIESSSPMPSLIPETPGPKAASNLRVVDGEEIDLNETIIVDDSILRQQDVPVVKRRKRKSDVLSDATVFDFKKGKLQDAAEETTQLPSQEEAKTKIYSPKKKTSPRKRSRRGRPSRMISVLGETSQPSPSRSFSSVDYEGSFQDSKEMEVTTEVVSTSVSEMIPLGNNEAIVERQEVASTAEELLTASDENPPLRKGAGDEHTPDETIDMSNPAISGDENMADAEMVADSCIGESSSVENRSSAGSNPEAEVGQDIVMSTSNIMFISLESVHQAHPAQVDVSVQTEEIMESPSVDGLKAKLQSIIGDLGTTALSREEMNELEDLFMDAKQQLYGAGRRGRVGC